MCCFSFDSRIHSSLKRGSYLSVETTDAGDFFCYFMVCVFLQEVLVMQRTALSDLLQQLLKQRDQREQELRQVLVRTYYIKML